MSCLANRSVRWLDRCGHAGVHSAAYPTDALLRPEPVAFVHPARAGCRCVPALRAAHEAHDRVSELDCRCRRSVWNRWGWRWPQRLVERALERQRWPRPDRARLCERHRSRWLPVPWLELDGRRGLSDRVLALHDPAARCCGVLDRNEHQCWPRPTFRPCFSE